MNEEIFQEIVTTETRVISHSVLFKTVQDRGFACAYYRLPQSNDVNIIIDTGGARNLDKLIVEGGDEGFVFHPFSSQFHDIKFIRKDIHLTGYADSHKLKVVYPPQSEHELRDVLDGLSSGKSNAMQAAEEVPHEVESDGKAGFLHLVNRAIENIRNEHFQKVVTARKKNIPVPVDFDPVILYRRLCQTYENSFVYLTYIPGIGVWCGATPEVLIEKDRNNLFKTVALAATQEKHPDIPITEVSWTQKDIEEQAMVSRYIINCFKKIRLREFDEVGPRSCIIGNLVHLKTDFVVDLNQVRYPNLCSEMLELLHPTSAVCGMPKQEAMQFISDHEGFDREYFSGYLGPVNIMEESHIFVNLRCMKLADSNASLFAGAGILANSQPEKEWHETEIKMQTVLSILENY